MFVLVLLFLFTLSFAAGQIHVYVFRGQDIIMKPIIPTNPYKIIWSYEGKILEFDDNRDGRVSFKNRIKLDQSTAELQIRNATFEDSGVFMLEALYHRYTPKYAAYHWDVLDNVTNTRINCDKETYPVANLGCSASSGRGELVKYEWLLNGATRQGTSLKIRLGGEYDEKIYTCRASNPLSKEEVKFTAKECYLENCVKCNKIYVPVIIIAVILPIVIVITGLVIWRCQATKKKNCEAQPSGMMRYEEDSEEGGDSGEDGDSKEGGGSGEDGDSDEVGDSGEDGDSDEVGDSGVDGYSEEGGELGISTCYDSMLGVHSFEEEK